MSVGVVGGANPSGAGGASVSLTAPGSAGGAAGVRNSVVSTVGPSVSYAASEVVSVGRRRRSSTGSGVSWARPVAAAPQRAPRRSSSTADYTEDFVEEEVEEESAVGSRRSGRIGGAGGGKSGLSRDMDDDKDDIPEEMEEIEESIPEEPSAPGGGSGSSGDGYSEDFELESVGPSRTASFVHNRSSMLGSHSRSQIIPALAAAASGRSLLRRSSIRVSNLAPISGSDGGSTLDDDEGASPGNRALNRVSSIIKSSSGFKRTASISITMADDPLAPNQMARILPFNALSSGGGAATGSSGGAAATAGGAGGSSGKQLSAGGAPRTGAAAAAAAAQHAHALGVGAGAAGHHPTQHPPGPMYGLGGGGFGLGSTPLFTAQSTLQRFGSVLASGAYPGLDPGTVRSIRSDLVKTAAAVSGQIGYEDIVAEAGAADEYRAQLARVRARLAAARASIPSVVPLQDKVVLLRPAATVTAQSTRAAAASGTSGGVAGTSGHGGMTASRIIGVMTPAAGSYRYTTLEDTQRFIEVTRPYSVVGIK
ncbi:hypothetical protein GPECTOR_12g393 [Gonium pectorale]|uniref:Uncharacterized protein n=1 Tax=Gonium pectorale TaxID=33097 RepID=A0A150GNQ4_GONPE|nr:hypothetical protein GPECTOR_12g393 [Gonium pectorale]|eukprot:KXZ51431.1 hypothetical protein GPECTOR_12g393 [Gonium pectorale]